MFARAPTSILLFTLAIIFSLALGVMAAPAGAGQAARRGVSKRRAAPGPDPTARLISITGMTKKEVEEMSNGQRIARGLPLKAPTPRGSRTTLDRRGPSARALRLDQEA